MLSNPLIVNVVSSFDYPGFCRPPPPNQIKHETVPGKAFLFILSLTSPFESTEGTRNKNQIKFSIEIVALVIQMPVWGLLCESNYSPLSGRSTG